MPSSLSSATPSCDRPPIPYNSPQDYPGCKGFVDQYAEAIGEATGKPVTVQNLSQHTGLTQPQLLEELDSFTQQLTAADVMLVGVAHNSFELNAEAPCGRPVVDDLPDWSAVDARCATESAARYEPMYQALYSRIRDVREGKPTLLSTINRYNDWIGFEDAGLSPAQNLKDHDHGRRLERDAVLRRGSERGPVRGRPPRVQRARRDDTGGRSARPRRHAPVPAWQRHDHALVGGGGLRTPGLIRGCAETAVSYARKSTVLDVRAAIFAGGSSAGSSASAQTRSRSRTCAVRSCSSRR